MLGNFPELMNICETIKHFQIKEILIFDDLFYMYSLGLFVVSDILQQDFSTSYFPRSGFLRSDFLRSASRAPSDNQYSGVPS